MSFKKLYLLLIAIFTIAFQSCEDKPKKETNTVEGNKHILSEDGVQILLPEGFARISTTEYISVLDKKENKKRFFNERIQLESSRKLNGNNYIFFNPKVNASFFVNSIPYSEIKKEDAQKLLGIIRQDQKLVSEISDAKFSKITAKFKAITGAQIFKTVFKSDFKKNKKTIFHHTYYISSKDKSLILNLITPEETNFDAYIEKIQF